MRYKYKTVNDYIDKVQEVFPFFTKEDIKQVLSYGLYMYYFANHFHCDVVIAKDINRPSMSTTTGVLTSNWEKFWLKWHTKWRMKERFLYVKLKKQWDGYYYFGLSEEENAQFSRCGKKKTVLRKYFTKIPEEFHHLRTVKHVWRVPWPKDSGYRFYIDKYTSSQFEYYCSNEYTDYHQWTRKENVESDQSVQSGTNDGLQSDNNS